jgi:hypothetical protein
MPSQASGCPQRGVLGSVGSGSRAVRVARFHAVQGKVLRPCLVPGPPLRVSPDAFPLKKHDRGLLHLCHGHVDIGAVSPAELHGADDHRISALAETFELLTLRSRRVDLAQPSRHRGTSCHQSARFPYLSKILLHFFSGYVEQDRNPGSLRFCALGVYGYVPLLVQCALIPDFRRLFNV